jgi:gamma-glutamylcyclotransferase (GGCT)/AIG2-like uncharacterized protein YtfP
MATTTYFAFGSNLDQRQMRARCPSAALVGPATLPRHSLAFGGFSRRWGGGVASVVRDRRGCVEGVLYTLSLEDLTRLDAFEGHPFYYERVTRYVVDEHGRRRRAQVYVLDPIVARPFPPSVEYLHVIARAYRRFGFDRRALSRALRMEVV